MRFPTEKWSSTLGPAVVIKLPNQRWILGECLGSCEGKGIKRPPQATTIAKGRDA